MSEKESVSIVSGVYVWASNDPYEMVWRIASRGCVGTTKTFVLVPWDFDISEKEVQA